uniref:Uncharacterized protein n=1 Tax=Anguilla anguilla TaxID=7936 RepID=A0A0E9XHL0_ANGAN
MVTGWSLLAASLCAVSNSSYICNH